MIETINKQAYETPETEVVEIKTEGSVLQSSIPDYTPENW